MSARPRRLGASLQRPGGLGRKSQFYDGAPTDVGVRGTAIPNGVRFNGMARGFSLFKAAAHLPPSQVRMRDLSSRARRAWSSLLRPGVAPRMRAEAARFVLGYREETPEFHEATPGGPSGFTSAWHDAARGPGEETFDRAALGRVCKTISMNLNHTSVRHGGM